MEDFLTHCETEADMVGTEMYEDGLGDDKACDQTDDIEEDCLALKKLLGSITRAKNAFNFKEIKVDRALTGQAPLREQYCSCLIQSELNTLNLYERAINLIMA